MSDNIIIQKKGVAQVLTNISELETSKQGGGSVTWVPEEERVLIKKTITKKGKYKASDDGAYGYSEVVVKLSKSSAADKPKEEEYTPASPTITIQEGGVGKVLNGVKKINVARQGGATSSWIPEENVELTTLTAHGNGTFKAKNMGYYGFSEVTASRKVKVVTKDDGNEYAQWDDGEEKIPSSIAVTTPPDKTSYIVAEPINTTGMVVTAYYGDGTEWGIVPSDEITIDPLVAPIGTDEEYIVDDEEILYNPEKFTFPVRFNKGSFQFENGEYIRTVSGECEAAFLGVTSTNKVTFAVAFSKTPFTMTARSEHKRTGNVYESTFEATLASTKSGTPVYVSGDWVSGYLGGDYIYGTTSEYSGGTFNRADPAAIYYEGVKQGGTADIEAKWFREDDDKELTDTFEITVTNPPVPSI